VADAIGTHGHGLVEVAKAPIYTPMLSRDVLFEPDDTVNYQENCDGFGIAFYPSNKALYLPALLRDCKPIWHSNNVGPIAGAVESSLVFGHVRKTMNFGSIAEQNCHPFRYGAYIFMHNGGVFKFHKVKNRMRMLISEFFDSVSKDHDIEYEIQGTTDSETLFFLILGLIAKKMNSLDFTKPTLSAEELKSCMLEGINIVLKLVIDTVGKIGRGCTLNLALSDGMSVIVTRFRNSKKQPPSLYYTLRNRDARKLQRRGSRVLCLDDEKTMHVGMTRMATEEQISTQEINMNFGFSNEQLPEVIMIASEPVDRSEEDYWELVPGNTINTITRKQNDRLEMKSERINIPMSLFMQDEDEKTIDL